MKESNMSIMSINNPVFRQPNMPGGGATRQGAHVARADHRGGGEDLVQRPPASAAGEPGDWPPAASLDLD